MFLRMVMSRGLALTGAGVVLGAAGALALTRLLGILLFKVSPRDPVSFASALAVHHGGYRGIAFCRSPKRQRGIPIV
jgi:hypothetical protein